MRGESGRNEFLRGPFALFEAHSRAKFVRNLIEGGDLCAERTGYRSGFSQLKALEFFVFRKMIMPETGNHLLCGWCSKCL